MAVTVYPPTFCDNGAITTAGTREALTATSYPAAWLHIQNNNVAAYLIIQGRLKLDGTTPTSADGVRIGPGETHQMPPLGQAANYLNLAEIFLDTDVNGATYLLTGGTQ